MDQFKSSVPIRAWWLALAAAMFSACSDGTAAGAGSAKDAAYALIVYRKDLRRLDWLDKTTQKKLDEIAARHHAMVLVEDSGPAYKRLPVPFELLRRNGEPPPDLLRRRWAWYAAHIRSQLSAEHRQRFDAMVRDGTMAAPTVKQSPRQQGWIIMWQEASGEAATTINVAGSVGGVAEALEAVRTPDLKRQREGLDWLAGAPTEAKYRQDVLAAAENLTGDRSQVMIHATGAIERWATAADRDLVYRMLGSKKREPQEAAVRTLLRLKDPGLGAALRKGFADHSFRTRTTRVLVQAGLAAEGVAIELLAVKDLKINRSACNLLRKIGGRRGLTALEAAIRSAPPHLDRGGAEGAVGVIQARLAEPVKP